MNGVMTVNMYHVCADKKKKTKSLGDSRDYTTLELFEMTRTRKLLAAKCILAKIQER